MLFRNIDMIDENLVYQQGMFIGIDGSYIDYIGTTAPESDYGEQYDGRGKLLIPGFYNAHSHAAMTLLRGYGENMALSDWLNKKIFPFEAKMTPTDIFNGTMLAIAEMLQYGTVSFTDMYYSGEMVAKAVLESGIKCNFSLGTLCFDDRDLYDLDTYQESKYLIENYHGSGDGRLLIDLCIHGEYTSTPKIVSQMAEFAKKTHSRMHIHLSETKQEHEDCKVRHGMTPAAYFDKLGVFSNPITAAHCVYLEERDFEIVKNKDFTIACCPASNMKLAGGFLNVPLMFKSGVNYAIGTDGCASNNNLNILKDAYMFSLIYKGFYGDPELVTPEQTLSALTHNGALSQGRLNSGSIKLGNFADLCIVKSDTLQMTPRHSELNNLIYAAQGSDILLTMVNGKILYRNGEFTTIDIERVKYEAQKSVFGILERLGENNG